LSPSSRYGSKKHACHQCGIRQVINNLSLKDYRKIWHNSRRKLAKSGWPVLLIHKLYRLNVTAIKRRVALIDA
jgi:hypothetical protein